ncbi:MAG: transporter [Burkholderiales bacterium]|nr:transporter [Burkholderiales bacterium]
MSGTTATLGATFVLLLSPLARAAHPLINEDPGTQGAGRFELEVGFAAVRGDPPGGRSWEIAPQLSYGATDKLDLIVRPSWTGFRVPGEDRQRGLGDTAVDVKWRFHESGDLQLGLRAGIDFPTGDSDKGLGSGRAGAHALVAIAVNASGWQWLANVGDAYSRADGERRHRPFVSAGFLAPAEGVLRASLEVAAQANADRDRSTWPAVARAGLLWQISDAWSVDVGAEGRLNRAAPNFTALAGATLRW